MDIRPYRESDEQAVIALWERCGLIVPWNDPAKDIRRKLSMQPEGFLVGEENGVLIGSVMVGFEGHRGWVNYLAIDPSCRKRGLGRDLMDAAEDIMRDKGCPKLSLQVRTSNADVIAFYRALGYVQDDVLSFGKRLEKDDEA